MPGAGGGSPESLRDGSFEESQLAEGKGRVCVLGQLSSTGTGV